jgi:hypothetical protein
MEGQPVATNSSSIPSRARLTLFDRAPEPVKRLVCATGIAAWLGQATPLFRLAQLRCRAENPCAKCFDLASRVQRLLAAPLPITGPAETIREAQRL